MLPAGEPGTTKIVGFQLDEVLALSSMRIKLTAEPEDKDFRQPQKLMRALRVRMTFPSSIMPVSHELCSVIIHQYHVVRLCRC